MNKNVFILLAMLSSSLAFSQVGINTSDPKATFDITAKNATGIFGNAEGFLAPRIDRERAQSMTGVETSTLIYVNDAATGTQTGTAANIDIEGFYYFDGSLWVKMSGSSLGDTNIYNTNGNLTGDRTVTQNANTLAFTGSTTNAFSVDGDTFSVDAANDRVGIGTSAPTTKLEINNGTTAGAVKIVDGTQGSGRVLTSDADGVATWSPTPATSLYFLSSSPFIPGAVDFAGTINPITGGSAGTNRYLSTGDITNLGPATTITSGAQGLSYAVPTSGIYRFTLYVDVASGRIHMDAYRSGVQIRTNSDNGGGSVSSVMINIWRLEAGDIVVPFAAGATGAETSFTVEKVY